MTILARFTKDPGEVFDYDIAYPTTELPASDSIADAQATAQCIGDLTNTAMTVGVVTFSNRRSKVWLADGTDKKDYLITVVATSAGGRILVDHFVLKVRGTSA